MAFGEIIPVVRDKFGLDQVILVGDRGSVTSVRIRQLRGLPGAGWITAQGGGESWSVRNRQEGAREMTSDFEGQKLADLVPWQFEHAAMSKMSAVMAERGRQNRAYVRELLWQR